MLTIIMLTSKRQQKIISTAQTRQQAAVVLEDIHDPHNAAAVFRNCEAFGVQDVYLIFNKQEKFNPRRVGKATSSSANKWLDFHTYTSVEQCMADLKKDGYSTLATILDAKAEPLFEAPVSEGKIAWLFGNEHLGLSPEIAALADRHIYIPMAGFVQSLNLSVTTGICLFEMTRQRQEKGLENYLLPLRQFLQLSKKWST